MPPLPPTLLPPTNDPQQNALNKCPKQMIPTRTHPHTSSHILTTTAPPRLLPRAPLSHNTLRRHPPSPSFTLLYTQRIFPKKCPCCSSARTTPTSSSSSVCARTTRRTEPSSTSSQSSAPSPSMRGLRYVNETYHIIPPFTAPFIHLHSRTYTICTPVIHVLAKYIHHICTEHTSKHL